ncbi:MAG: hypothetical protein U0531_07970 [Dehalococcoidia bacterium]
MVESARDLMEDDLQMRPRPLRHDGASGRGAFGTTACPRASGAHRGRLRRPAPVLGEHTHARPARPLGLSDDDITNLVIAGAME